MSELRQLLLGALAAVVSAAIILGGLSISMAESGIEVARQSVTTPSPTEPFVITAVPLETDATRVPQVTPDTPTSTPVCQGPAGWRVITFLAGDSMESLAQEYGISTEELIEANCGVRNPPLGTDLYVPPPTPTPKNTSTNTLTPTYTATAHTPKTPTSQAASCGPPAGWISYRVRRGDTYYQLGRLFRTSPTILMQANCWKSLVTGDFIWVPNKATITPTATRVVPTNTPMIPTATAVVPSPTSPSPSATPVTPVTSTPVPDTPTASPPTATDTPAPPPSTPEPPTSTPSLPVDTPTPPPPPNTIPPPPARATPTPTTVQEESSPQLLEYIGVDFLLPRGRYTNEPL